MTNGFGPQNGMFHYGMRIGGSELSAISGKTFETEDPSSGEVWAVVPDGDVADVDDAVQAARDALSGPWAQKTGSERAALMRNLATLIARDADLLAAVETRDNGKLLRETTFQMNAMSEYFYYYAGLADKIEGATIPSGKTNFLVYTSHEPIGVVGAITPWNSPILLMCWKLAPALAAGCTMVVKPSDYTPASTLEFASLVAEAGFPSGVFNVVTGVGPTTGSALARHPGVDKIAFTGSTRTGISVGLSAIENLNHVSLELGGKSAQLVFPDADLDATANGIVAGVFAATGQSCMAGSRVLIHEAVYEDLIERIVARATKIRLGDPADSDTQMGPLSNKAQYQKVLDFLKGAVDEGATIAYGGRPATQLGGLFVEPTIIRDATSEMTVVREEVFGPVVAIMRFSTEQEAVSMANATPYGLAASVWTKDIHRGHRIARELQAGTVWINAYRVVAPGAPFGGYKMSGIGRENGIDSVKAYTETKTVWVELSGISRDPFILG